MIGAVPSGRRGSVFRLAPGGGFEQIHSFKGEPHGSHPHAGLIEGLDGLLYGSTYGAPPWLLGTVFCMDKSGAMVSGCRSWTARRAATRWPP